VEALTRVCLLTGASGPLGTAFIETCAERYAIIAVHHRNGILYATQDQAFVDPLEPKRAVPQNKRAVHAVRADLSDPQEVDRVVAEVVDRFGRVDLLVNAAATRRFSHVLTAGALEPADAVMSVNVLAPLRLCVALANACWRADPDANLAANRNVVNISSTAGLYVYPDLGQALYATSKAALNHLTYHLASDLWDIGIRVNAVTPDTFPGRVPIEQVLDAILTLDTSDETGQIVTVALTTEVAP
jgi:NAD(P)-dependent dehydrogenase (short-subunit alcohol dehydrogenase family)